MKMFMKYLLVATISLTVGGILGWVAFSSRIKRQITPIVRTQHREINIDFTGKYTDIDFHFSSTGNTLKISGQLMNTESALEDYLTRVATFSTSCWLTVSFNREVTVQQVRSVDERIRSFGFPSPLMLIEENRGTRTGEEERVFREIRIGEL